MKLSERLARGAIVMRDTAQMKTQHPEWLIKEMDQSADLLDEAAALARRVEGAQERTVVQDREGFLYVGAMAAGLDFRQRVRLVPDVPPPSTEGGED